MLIMESTCLSWNNYALKQPHFMVCIYMYKYYFKNIMPAISSPHLLPASPPPIPKLIFFLSMTGCLRRLQRSHAGYLVRVCNYCKYTTDDIATTQKRAMYAEIEVGKNESNRKIISLTFAFQTSCALQLMTASMEHYTYMCTFLYSLLYTVCTYYVLMHTYNT